MLVESLEKSDEGSTVLKDDLHPVVEMSHHLIILGDSHLEALVVIFCLGPGNKNIEVLLFQNERN